MNAEQQKRPIHRLPGWQLAYYADELHTLEKFFDCKSADDLTKAVQRYEFVLLDSDNFPPSPGQLDRTLAMAAEHYLDFCWLDKPLTSRHKTKQNGPSTKERGYSLPELDKMIQVEQHRQPGRTVKQTIKYLQDVGRIPNDLKPSTIEKELQQYRQMLADFKNVLMSEPTDFFNTEANPIQHKINE